MTRLSVCAVGGSVRAWRQPREALERLGEMMDVGEAAVLSDVPLRQISRAQELPGVLDAEPQGNH